MYQNYCKKCGSTSLFIEKKGNNTGLYCSDCGAWIKWLGKGELKAFEHSMSEEKAKEKETMVTQAKELLERNGYVVVKWTEDMEKDATECADQDAEGDLKDCSVCNCVLCLNSVRR